MSDRRNPAPGWKVPKERFPQGPPVWASISRSGRVLLPFFLEGEQLVHDGDNQCQQVQGDAGHSPTHDQHGQTKSYTLHRTTSVLPDILARGQLQGPPLVEPDEEGGDHYS